MEESNYTNFNKMEKNQKAMIPLEDINFEEKEKKRKMLEQKTKGGYFLSQIQNKGINKCICKIQFVYEDKETKKKYFVEGTGFFCKIKNIDNDVIFLLTNNHVIGQQFIDHFSDILQLKINDSISKNIDFSKNRFKLTNKDIDYTAIEILESDDISDYLEVENEDYLEVRNYENSGIYCLEYPTEMNCRWSDGVIKKIKNNEIIMHNLATNEGSSGAPIILKENHKVIAMHLGKKPIDKLRNNAKEIPEIPLGIYFDIIIKDMRKYMKKLKIEKEGKLSKFFEKSKKFCWKNILNILYFLILLIIIILLISQNLFEDNHKKQYYDHKKKK